MPVLAAMFTIATYGTWLRGDRRNWVDDGIEFPPDLVLEAYDKQHLKAPPFYFDPRDQSAVAEAIGESLTQRLNLNVYAICVQSWHSHFVVGATDHDPAMVVKCAKDAARWRLRVGRRIWGTDYDKRYCFDENAVRTRIAYVERHNLRARLKAGNWGFIRKLDSW